MIKMFDEDEWDTIQQVIDKEIDDGISGQNLYYVDLWSYVKEILSKGVIKNHD